MRIQAGSNFRKGQALRHFIRSPLLLGGLAFVTGRCETLKGDDLRKTPPARLVLDLVRAIAIRARASLRNRHQRPFHHGIRRRVDVNASPVPIAATIALESSMTRTSGMSPWDMACSSSFANWANSATGPRFCEALEIPLHRHHAATVKRCPHDPLNDWQRGRTSDHRKPAISCDRRRLQPHLFHGRTRRPQWYSPPLRDDARRAHASKDPPGLRCKSRIPGSCARRNEGAVSRLHFFGSWAAAQAK